MNDIVFYSFYTTDDYYKNHAKQLSEALDELGVEYYFEPFDIPDGMEWPDLCRKKIGMIYRYYQRSDKKVIWIDIDCRVTEIPDVVKNFSADVIGFQRGFGQPKKIGYYFKARFWEPCFLGFNKTPEAEMFLKSAVELEQCYEGKATDDYFFEEAWRNCSSFMSYQFIPSSMALIKNRKVSGREFFEFGSSGNVQEYVDKVDQHAVGWINKKTYVNDDKRLKVFKKIYNKMPKKIRLKIKKMRDPHFKNMTFREFKKDIITAAKKGDGASVNKVVRSQLGVNFLPKTWRDVLSLANAFLSYRKGNESNPINLAWWANPEPGNFGDWLSPYIFHKISERSIAYVNPQSKSTKKEHYFSVGSIGRFVKDNSVVMGVGCSTAKTNFSPKANYRFVRGPLTREYVLNAGGQCPEIYGDPAIVLPKIYNPKPVKKYQDKYLLVRHFKHADVEVNISEEIEEVSILRSHPRQIENFIDTLASSKGVITTAMHCYIVCQAYGIPAALVTLEGAEDAVHGDGTKYHDYLLGVGKDGIDPPVISRNITKEVIEMNLQNDPILDERIDQIYSILCDELKK